MLAHHFFLIWRQHFIFLLLIRCYQKCVFAPQAFQYTLENWRCVSCGFSLVVTCHHTTKRVKYVGKHFNFTHEIFLSFLPSTIKLERKSVLSICCKFYRKWVKTPTENGFHSSKVYIWLQIKINYKLIIKSELNLMKKSFQTFVLLSTVRKLPNLNILVVLSPQ